MIPEPRSPVVAPDSRALQREPRALWRRPGALWRADRADVGRPVRRDAWAQVWLVLALSLLASAVYAVLSLAQTLNAPGGLRAGTATLHRSLSAVPVFDLVRQVAGIAFALVPVALAIYLLGGPLVAGSRAGWTAGARVIGFDARRPRSDLAVGAALALVIGVPGLVLYLGAHAAGLAVTVNPGNLPAQWWSWAIYLLSAAENAVLEETVVVGFVLTRLRQAGVGFGPAVLFSALLRGSYHLYQGFGGFVGNAIMGVVFAMVYRRTGRVMPLVVAHTLIDIVAFVGYALLAGHVSWLPS